MVCPLFFPVSLCPLTCHLSPSPLSTVGAIHEATRFLQSSRSLQHSTISWSPLNLLASTRFPTRFLAGLPRFLLPSIFPISTVDIKVVLLCLTACPKYFSLHLFISVSRILFVLSSTSMLSFVLLSVHFTLRSLR